MNVENEPQILKQEHQHLLLALLNPHQHVAQIHYSGPGWRVQLLVNINKQGLYHRGLSLAGDSVYRRFRSICLVQTLCMLALSSAFPVLPNNSLDGKRCLKRKFLRTISLQKEVYQRKYTHIFK